MRCIKLFASIAMIFMFIDHAFAKAEVYVDSLDVNTLASAVDRKDTVWFVNHKFNPNTSSEVNFKLLFTNYDDENLSGRVTWQKINAITGVQEGAPGNKTIPNLKDTLKFDVFDEGIYFLKFTLDTKEIHAFLFNKKLEFEIIDVDVEDGTCLNGEPDTCIFGLKNHLWNPKGTRYKMYSTLGDNEILVDKEKVGNREDIFYVIFNGPSGDNDMMLTVVATYVNPRNKKTIRETRSREKAIHKYDRPKLSRIFNFDEESAEDLNGCAEEVVEGFSYNEGMNVKYMDYTRLPEFKAKENFDIRYFRKDSLKQIDWVEITAPEKEKYVRDTSDIIFLLSGLYRVRMMAENYCGADTLDTEEVADNELLRRLIRIYRNDVKDLAYSKNLLCLSGETESDTLTIKDYAFRLKWEGDPDYEVSVGQIVPKTTGGDSVAEVKVTDGIYKVLPTQPYYSEGERCDSTILPVVFYKMGHYRIILTKKSSECSEVQDTVMVKVAKSPLLAQNFLEEVAGKPIDKADMCGSYTFDLPASITADSNNSAVDRYEWKFGKGSLEQKFSELRPFDQFVFDSLNGAASYITLRVGNGCGWSDMDSVSFFTYDLPDVKIWIDSVENNFTVCAESEYDYHFKGHFPEYFLIQPGGTENDSVVRRVSTPEEGEYTLKYTVKNNHEKLIYSECKQEIEVNLRTIAPPVFQIPDTVHFCSDVTEIQTWALLEVPYNELSYEKLAWQVARPVGGTLISGTDFPAGLKEELKKDFQKLVISDEESLLNYYVSSGGEVSDRQGGCYGKGKVALLRHPVPVLSLNTDVVRECEGKTVNIASWLVSSIEQAQHLSIRIDGEKWFDADEGDTDILSYGCPATKDSVTVIFEAGQRHDYAGSEGCSLLDSVKVYIDHPRVYFQKKDTLNSNDNIYRFDRIRNYTDTSDISNLTWSVLKGNPAKLSGTDDIFQYTYDFTGETQGDSVGFELKGTSFCGDVYKDTLWVLYPEFSLTGGEAWICNTIGTYPLWSSVPDDTRFSGEWIELADDKLTFRIMQGMDLATIGGRGVNSYLALTEKGKSVGGEIIVEVATRSYFDHQSRSAELKITVHLAPEFKLNLAESDLVLVEKDTLQIQTIGTVVSGTDFVWKQLTSGGELINAELASAEYVPAYSGHTMYPDSLVVRMKVKAGMQKGCGEWLEDTLHLKVFPVPQVLLSPDTVDMCAGEILKLGASGGSHTEVKGDAPVLKWTTSSGCTDCLKNQDDSNVQIDFEPATDGVEMIYLSAKQVVRNYRGQEKTMQDLDSIAVVVYGEPFLQVDRARDTICYGTTAVDLSGIGVHTTEGVVTYSTVGLSGIYPHYTMPVSVRDSAKVYVHAYLGGCTKWEDKTDSITIVRLPELQATLLYDEDAVCENGTLTLAATTNTSKYFWQTKQGGMLTATEGLTPVYHPVGGIEKDTVVLTLQPELETCTDSKEVKEVIQVVKLPVFMAENDSICADIGQYTVPLQEVDHIAAITWSSSSGGSFVDGVNNIPNPVYRINSTDRANGEVILYAGITMKAPCASNIITRQIKLTLLKVPELTIDRDAILPLCQGDSLDIGFVSYSSDVTGYKWYANGGNFDDTEKANPRFYIGEYDRDFVQFQVSLTGTVYGSYQCNSGPYPIKIPVARAPKPEIQVSGTQCEDTEIGFTTNVFADRYLWNHEGIEPKVGLNVGYRFESAGEKEVELEVVYENGCHRYTTEKIEVYENPVASFKADSTLVAIGREVNFINRTENIDRQWWYVENTNLSMEKDFQHTFTAGGDYRVALEVENARGCRDKKEEDIHVLLVPKAGFEVVLEDPARPCDGSKAIFTNLSTGTDYVHYKWLLNTVTTGVDTTTEIPQGEVRYYASPNQDTIYKIYLVAENVAGADTAEQTIEIVSLLEADLKAVAGGDAICADFDREYMNLTRGSADWYRITWGDGTDTLFTDRQNGIIRHKYTNSTYETILDTIEMCTGNVCEEDCMRLPIQIRPNSATAKIQIDEQVGAEGCYMFDAKFHNISLGFGGVKKALWDFGEGDPILESKGETITNLYEKPGTYQVVLTIFDECNRSTDTAEIKVTGDDRLAFSVHEGPLCSEQGVTMEVDPEIRDQFYEYSWNFYFGSPGNAWTNLNEVAVEKTWAAGTYKVALKAKSLDGCTVYKPVIRTVEINETPLADFQFRYEGEESFRDRNQAISGCSPMAVDFKCIGNREEDVVLWDFNDGGWSSEERPTHSFTRLGASSVKLKVTSPVSGCVDSLVKDILVKETPEADFINRAGNLFCADGKIKLDIDNIGADPGNVAYRWSYRKPADTEFTFWDDKAVPEKKWFENSFGEMMVKLEATHMISGCTTEKTDTIISSPAITGEFKIEKEKVCDGEAIRFRVVPRPDDRISWDLGDRSVAVQETDFVYTYGAPGNYRVKLSVQNEYGCEMDSVMDLWVYPLPVADFSYEEDRSVLGDLQLPEGIDVKDLPDIKNGGIRFTGRSWVEDYDFADNTLNYVWDFGDGSAPEHTVDPAHRFVNNGRYDVKLRVKTIHGCADSISESIYIDAVKGLYIPNAFAPATGVEENPGMALFQPKGIGLLEYKIKVYDQWGTCVWMSDKLRDGRPAEAWDGTFQGQPMPKDTYLWEVHAIFIDGSVWSDEKGNTEGKVLLIR